VRGKGVGGLCPRVSLQSVSSVVHGLPQSQMFPLSRVFFLSFSLLIGWQLVACHVTLNETNEHLPHGRTAYFSIVRSKSWVNKGHFRSRISNSILWTNNYDQSLLFIPTNCTFVKYMYSSPFTSHMFRCYHINICTLKILKVLFKTLGCSTLYL
jgi:hypothetical protein